MNRVDIYSKINELLENTDYPVEVSNVTSIEEFLNREENTGYDVYDEIDNLYNKLMMGDEDE